MKSPLSHSHFSAILLLTIITFAILVLIGLVFSIYDSTEEVAIQKMMIDASQGMLKVNSQECEHHDVDHCKQCAQACRNCAEECRKMAR